MDFQTWKTELDEIVSNWDEEFYDSTEELLEDLEGLENAAKRSEALKEEVIVQKFLSAMKDYKSRSTPSPGSLMQILESITDSLSADDWEEEDWDSIIS